MTMSIGITELAQSDGDSTVALARADKALYLAKDQGATASWPRRSNPPAYGHPAILFGESIPTRWLSPVDGRAPKYRIARLAFTLSLESVSRTPPVMYFACAEEETTFGRLNSKMVAHLRFVSPGAECRSVGLAGNVAREVGSRSAPGRMPSAQSNRLDPSSDSQP